jgi:ubiquinone/menaquinone biosynthesis C-methylase UbiE
MAENAPSDPAAVGREKEFWEEHLDEYGRVRPWIDRAIGEFTRGGDMHDAYDPRGKNALDYGCGDGALSVRLLQRGAARVTGIDISEVLVDQARRRAAAAGFADRTRFIVADAHATGFADGEFDLVVGIAILHHLDLARALPELRRILAPGGTAVFLEPLWHNPLLRIGRKLTPSVRTEDEHPFTEQDWELCASIFPRFEHSERELVTIPLMPLNFLLPARARRPLARWVHRVDDGLLAKYPGLGKYARVTILVFGANGSAEEPGRA